MAIIQRAAPAVPLTVEELPVIASFLMLRALLHITMTINGRWNMGNAGISAGRILTANNWELVDDQSIARCSMTINGHSSTSSTVVHCTVLSAYFNWQLLAVFEWISHSPFLNGR